ncbi:heterokaryon incompatibility protein-domain-containing protein [Thelonectria olida]|uniref:Heterokaryon incompatibility protein-domain-containing protein n=1 Tax=Thelonectria olida TaxID=1576542 RepID=A0A9P8VUN9_9HYPO|nr:heterokaryon incompatibility protein-domain-containing protein [Thelonectria olida]
MDISIPPFEFKPFECTPLPSPRSIRLLWLIKRPEQSVPYSISGVPLIECQLAPVDLHDAPGYNALSYTWGNPKPPALGSVDEYSASHRWPIAVNGRLFYVTRNLHELLCRLQQGEIIPPQVDHRLEPYDKTELIQYAEKGDVQKVMKLLGQGASHECQDRFVLLLHGAQGKVFDTASRTPLMCCLQRKRGRWRDVAKLLRNWDNHGADETVPAPCFPKGEMGIWIDALCINQEDIQERNNQVGMMSQIYGLAWCVVSWVGEADDTTEMARDAITRPHKTIWERDGYIIHGSYMLSVARSFDSLRDESLDRDTTSDEIKISVRELEAIRSLLRRSWFKRTWVIQETALAQDITVYSGPYQFKWIELSAFLQVALGGPLSHLLLADRRSTNARCPPIKYWRGGPGTGALSLTDIRIWSKPDASERDVVERFRAKHFPGRRQQKKLGLPALLVLSWNFAVSDPRDKVFALPSIVRPVEGIVADYSKSTTEVFTQVGNVLIQAEGDYAVENWLTGETDDLEPLEALSFIRPLHPWTIGSGSLDQAPSNSRPQLDSSRILDKQFNSSGDRLAVFYTSRPETLKLDGVMIDNIIEMEGGLHLTVESRLINIALGEWLDMVSRLDAIYPTGENRVQALWQTLMVGKQRGDDQDKVRAYFKFVLRSMTGSRRRSTSSRHSRLCQIREELYATDSSSSLPSLKEVNSNHEGLSEEGKDCMRKDWIQEDKLMDQLSVWLQNRGVMRTKGGYLGLASQDIKVNDQVWLLAGGRTPFILRSADVSGRFTFVSEAYVHGVMNGEVLRAKEDAFKAIEIK